MGHFFSELQTSALAWLLLFTYLMEEPQWNFLFSLPSYSNL